MAVCHRSIISTFPLDIHLPKVSSITLKQLIFTVRFFNGTVLPWADPIDILKVQSIIFFSKQQLQKMLRVIVFFKTIQIISIESHIIE